MSRRSDIEHEIHSYERKKDECKGRKSRLEEIHESMSRKRTDVENDVYESERIYDMTFGEKFRGKLEQNSEEYQFEINIRTDAFLSNTAQFMSSIKRAIERLEEMIEEYRNHISKLEAELASLDADKY